MQPHHLKQYGSLFIVLALVATLLGVPPIPAYAGAPASVNFTPKALPTPITTITRVSVDSNGTQGNAPSYSRSISADGRYVAFTSYASNLVSGDTNNDGDICLRDTQTGTTTRISVDSNGIQGNTWSDSPSISADGRYVAFRSDSSNLVSGDTNGTWDIFRHDIQTGITTRISLDSSGTQGNSRSYFPSISADGRYVAFSSGASNLVSGDTDWYRDVFLHDIQTGTTTRISVDSSGIQGNGDSDFPSISADGRYVAFESSASNLVSGDTNSMPDIFLHDTQTGITTRLSVDSSGTQGNSYSHYPSISADGRYVAFSSGASNLVNGDSNGITDVFLRDTQTGITTCISVNSSGPWWNTDSNFPSISADGRYVAFDSSASNLVSGDSNGSRDIFLRDTQTGTTTRISVDSSGTQGDSDSNYPSISADGRYVLFNSFANNLVSGDTNNEWDVFVVPATTLFALTVNKTGPGSGTVTSSPAGIICGAVCSYAFTSGTIINLSAPSAPGSYFTGWSDGGCSGTGTCTLTMDADKSVTARFDLIYRIYLPLVIR
jgi:Tol biopolymer transport system component